jgi:two-component system nitrogen regulation sensor histidine kinase NtrY
MNNFAAVANDDGDSNRWQRLTAWARRFQLSQKLTLLLVVLATIAGLATYSALTNVPPFANGEPTTVYWLLTLDIVLLLLLGGVVVRRVVVLWHRRQSGNSGARLHGELVRTFSLISLIPALVMFVFASSFVFLVIQQWFGERVRTAIDQSSLVADAYLDEHQQNIRADVLAMSNDLSRSAPEAYGNPEFFNQLLRTQSLLRNLQEAIVFDSSRRILARSGLTFSLELDPLNASIMESVREGETRVIINDKGDRVRALVRLPGFSEAYLYVGRLVDPKVLAYTQNAKDAVGEYKKLEGSRGGLLITISVIFAVVAFLLTLVSVWVGLMVAGRLANPLGSLIQASERVRAGDLSARVDEQHSYDEIGDLQRAFNRMTSQLDSQRRELFEINRKLDDRRRFSEAVLAGVSAGVMTVDADGIIQLTNDQANKLLGRHDLLGARLHEISDEFENLRQQFLSDGALAEGAATVPYAADEQGAKQFQIRLAALSENRTEGVLVITFDDITALEVAQRQAAWGDVARRIAHEIKNPLTPIQLAAERLRRKYRNEIVTEPSVFENCLDTIVRQVSHVGRMVGEFASFARMPVPELKAEDLKSLIEESVFLQRQAHVEIDYQLIGLKRISLPIDAGQISQALTNLLQNAAEAIEGREGDILPKGEIDLSVELHDAHVTIKITDNGRGLPNVAPGRLMEPYMTTRVKGTGLGLAIVKKIISEHGGQIELTARQDGQPGATVILQLPLQNAKDNQISLESKKNHVA